MDSSGSGSNTSNLSKRTKKNHKSRDLFSLPLHYEPILSYSPRSYRSFALDHEQVLGEKSVDKSKDSPSRVHHVPPRSPQALRAKESSHSRGTNLESSSSSAGSPRAKVQCSLPIGIVSKEDAELYRYQQSAMQLVAIRPLLEEKREEEAEIARQILIEREKRRENDALVLESFNLEVQKGSDKGFNNGKYKQELRKDVLDSDLLIASRAIDTSTFHEYFMPDGLNSCRKYQEKGLKSRNKSVVRYKVLWKEQKAIKSVFVRLQVILNSEGNVHMSINSQERSVSIHLSIDQIAESVILRPDLNVLTPQWAEWVTSCVAVDPKGDFILQLSQNPEDRVEDPPNVEEKSSLNGIHLVSVSQLARHVALETIGRSLISLKQMELAKLYSLSYIHKSISALEASGHQAELVKETISKCRQEQQLESVILTLIEDMTTEIVAYQCRMEFHNAKYSGGQDDFFATKLQATYRMSTQRRNFLQNKHLRLRAAKVLQAFQRDILACRRYCDMKIEREKYFYYRLHSSPHQSSFGMEHPKQRSLQLATETERRRQNFLMQVIHGYVADQGIPIPFMLPMSTIQNLFNAYGIVVGCPTYFGDVVAAILKKCPHSHKESRELFTSAQINASLLLALRSLYDTFGLSSQTRLGEMDQVESAVVKEHMQRTVEVPPRWLLKASIPFHRSNRNRLNALRLSKKEAGQKAAHLIAKDYRSLLQQSFQGLEACRFSWEQDIHIRREQNVTVNTFTLENLVQYSLDRLIASVKDWGIDPDELFTALNTCLLHHDGREAMQLLETKFNEFAEGVNKLHNKRHVYSLREEICQELEEFEKLIAIQCLNHGRDLIPVFSSSEILNIVLQPKVDEDYIRYALPIVLPIASLKDKYELAKRMIFSYANPSYGDAFNRICWSCLDAAENVTVESAQLLRKMAESLNDNDSVLERALFILVGTQAVRFLQIISKVGYYNKAIQGRVLELLQPYSSKYQMYRMAAVLVSVNKYEEVQALFQDSFKGDTLRACSSFWRKYREMYGPSSTEDVYLSLH